MKCFKAEWTQAKILNNDRENEDAISAANALLLHEGRVQSYTFIKTGLILIYDIFCWKKTLHSNQYKTM